MSAALTAQVRLDRAGFTLEAQIEVAAGQVLAVMGPNASGKSTLLQVVAGLLIPQEGTVQLGDRVLTSPDVHLAPEHRGIGLLGQDPLLFPHLSAAENVAFGLRSAGMRRSVALRQAQDWLDRVGIGGLGGRRPGALSGGQAQRVALARALAPQPQVVLLDEPLAALDAEAAPAMRQVLAEQLRETGTTAVFVSHDLLDVTQLADQVVVLRQGAIVEVGPVAAVFDHPATAFTEALVAARSCWHCRKPISH